MQVILLEKVANLGNLGDVVKVKKLIKPLTLKQLNLWGLKYHKIYFGKPSFDLFIDDKSLFFKKDWTKSLEDKLKLDKK